MPRVGRHRETTTHDRAQSPCSVHPRVRGARRIVRSSKANLTGTSPRARGKVVPILLGAILFRYIPACAGQGPLDNADLIESVGTSPRARGKAEDPRIQSLHFRYIPACAGQGIIVFPVAARLTVHPRVRGARSGASNGVERDYGTSPRARGKVFSSLSTMRISGYIPACAGQGLLMACIRSARAVHPRVRGARFSWTGCCFASCGTSPRARGKGSCTVSALLSRRYIPACAGQGHSPI